MRQVTPLIYSRKDDGSSAPVRAERKGDYWSVFCSFLGQVWFWNQFQQFWELVDEDKLGPAHRIKHSDAFEVLQYCPSKGELSPKYSRADYFLFKSYLRVHRWICRNPSEKGFRLVEHVRETVEELTAPVYSKRPHPKHKPEVLAYEAVHPETGVVFRASSWEGGWVLYCMTPLWIRHWNPESQAWEPLEVVVSKEAALRELRQVPSPLERKFSLPISRETSNKLWQAHQVLGFGRGSEEESDHLLELDDSRSEGRIEVIFRKVPTGA